MDSDDVPSTPAIDRRSFLRATGAWGTLAAATTAGCADLRAADRDDVVLAPPEDYDEDAAAEYPHPTYGDEIPEVTIPAPLLGREVTTTDFVGERHSLYTFLFTRCSTACPGLMANLVHVQADSLEEGYAEDVALCPVTFDPEHDTPEVLATYEEDHGVDRDVGNWYTLRPETPAAAEDVVEGEFGVTFAEAGGEDGEGDGSDGDGMAFMHTNLVLIVNEGGHVERAYTGDVPTPVDVVDDVRTLIEEW